MMTRKQSFWQKIFPSADDDRFFGRWIRNLLVASALLSGAYQGIGNNLIYSEGARTGMINKFSKKGLVWKTYEGRLALERMVSDGNNAGANVWEFSLDRTKANGENIEELAEKIKEHMTSENKVKITYLRPLATWPWRSNTNYLIQSIEPVERKDTFVFD